MQDTVELDDLNTIEGNMIISMVETKGLILPKEISRKK